MKIKDSSEIPNESPPRVSERRKSRSPGWAATLQKYAGKEYGLRRRQ